MIGQKIRDYEILKEMAKGGQGAIYLAHEPTVGRDVAIKMILPQYADKPEFKQRFESEARLIAQLEHPHIVPLYSYWQDKQGAFLVMRLIKGGSLRDLMQTQGTLSLSHVKRILFHLTAALTVAHKNNVIHRDIKPENILLDDLGNSYLTDFGIAKQINKPSNLTATDGIMGSWKYISPEQIQSEPIAPQTDIYALGIILYEMLTGEHPFKDDAVTMLIIRHLQNALPDIHDSRPDVPHTVNTVIQTATAKEQAQRYPDAETFFQAFEQATITPVQPSQGTIAVAQPQPITIEERNRQTMLQNVRTFWVEGVLEQSLYRAVRIELGMSEAVEAVDNPWQTVLKVAHTPDETLTEGTSILNIYERLQGKLLILGEPGSGKTATLLELARDLLNRAESDNAHPIPVVFNLSSWAENRKSLTEWMVDELNSKYQVPRKLGTQWVAAEQILPLLDGLDEVAVDYRDACVEMINAYRGEHGFVDVVVCSRIADYEALTNKLRLNGAIVLQPLQREQVDDYLRQMGSELDAVRLVLEEDEKLRQLTTSPLMLHILILAYRGVDIGEIPKLDTLEGRRKHLFETYVNRMLERRGTAQTYPPEKTKAYLQYLAQQLSHHALSVFHIEEIQPDWLQGFRQRAVYVIGLPLLTSQFGCGFITLILAVFLSSASFFVLLPNLFTLQLPTTFVGWMITFTPIISIMIALLIYRRFPKNIQIRSSNWSRRRKIIIALMLGMVSSGIGLLPLLFWSDYRFFLYLTLFGNALGLFASIGYVRKKKIQSVVALRWSWQQAFKGARVWGVRLASIPIVFILIALIFTIFSGEWRSTMFSELEESLLGLIGVSVAIIVVALMYGVLGAFIGLFRGIQTTFLSSSERPNQGIWRSAQLSLVVITTSIIISSIVMVMVATGVYVVASIDEVTALQIGLGIVSFFLIFILPIIALISGGYAAIQHIILRTIMWMSGMIPRNLAHFLDFATASILIRKVGGGYIFIHRLLLDYFANLDADEDDSERINRLSDSINATDGWDTSNHGDDDNQEMQKQ